MKKTITIMIGLFAIICFSNNVYAAAATWTQSEAGADVTIGSGTNNVTFSASPGVIVEGANDITVYCILTGNSKAAANAIAYCVASNSGKVAQRALDLTTSTDLGTPTTDGTLVSGFETK